MNDIYKSKSILVTGGASFIASHLVEHLLNAYEFGTIRLVDNLSSGRLTNIKRLLEDGRVEFLKADLMDREMCFEIMDGVDVVFHFAAVHGGRGFIGFHDAYCVDNVFIDRNVVDASLKAGVQKFFYASSGCVYPLSLQTDVKAPKLLKEEDVPPYEADGVYGTAKLMGEVLLRQASDEGKLMDVAIGRLFTVYGERALENHAIMALIAKSYIKQDPYEVWGEGNQIRNWTYVSDTVEGILRMMDGVKGYDIANIGSREGIKIMDGVAQINEELGFTPNKFMFLKDMPVGPIVRIADMSRMKNKYSWEPKIDFKEGIKKTIKWFKKNKREEELRDTLGQKLISR